MLLPLSKSIIAANIILPTLAVLAVVLRWLARRSKKLSLGADDYSIGIALVFFCLSPASSAVAYYLWDHSCWSMYCRSLGSMSQHDCYPNAFDVPRAACQSRQGIWSGCTTWISFKMWQLLWVDVLLCHLCYGVIKISILLFYRRIFVTPWFRHTVYVFIGVVSCWMMAAFLVSVKKDFCENVVFIADRHSFSRTTQLMEAGQPRIKHTSSTFTFTLLLWELLISP